MPNSDPYPLVDSEGYRYGPFEGGCAVAESGANAGHWVEIGSGVRYDPRPEYEEEDENE